MILPWFSKLELVISVRLHTSELALAVNTPVIPVEGAVFKTKEVLELVQYPLRVSDVRIEGWVEEILEQVEWVYQNYDMLQDWTAQNIPTIRRAAEENARWSLSPATA